MKELQLNLPFFHDLLSDLAKETSLPGEWKGLLLHLTDCLKNPFVPANRVKESSANSQIIIVITVITVITESKYSW